MLKEWTLTPISRGPRYIYWLAKVVHIISIRPLNLGVEGDHQAIGAEGGAYSL